jgi:tetratricopeptide (TPR) repeat protein
VGYRFLLVFLLILPLAVPLPRASAAYCQSQGQSQEAAPKPSSRRSTGWFHRPAGAGDFQEVVDLPNLERPDSLADYLPKNRDLAATCRAQTRAYDEFIAALDEERARLEAKRLSDLDPEILRLPRLYERLGNLASYNGDMETAIKRLETAYQRLNDTIDFFPNGERVKLFLEEEIGAAYLRRGELQNCQLNHNAEMCILPLSVQAQHKLTASAERAAEYFKKYLASDPDNLEVRWLLNLTYMTLGKYPEAVPKAQLIPPAAFESKENIGRFRDVATDVGISVVGNAGGMVADDFDNDGLLDVMMSGSDPCEPLHYYHNNGDGSFSDWTARAGLSDQLGGLNCIQTDYNNDGWLDLFVMRGGWDYPTYNSLLRNNGDGTFTDVTARSGLDTGAYRTHSAVWADFDNDGWLDVFIGHEMDPGQLFRNRGDGTFEDVSRAAGVNRTAFTKGACWGDYDNDGYADLYVSNFGEENFLYHNNRDGTFTEVGKQLGVEKPLMSFPCWFFDYDNDGFLDLFVASFMPSVTEVVRGFLGLAPQAETMRLYHNTGKGTFVDVTKAVGLDRVVPTMGANFGDLDNDGYLDFYLGTGAPSYGALMPNFMFRNQAGKLFVDVTGSTGTGHLQKGHGVAFSDVNNDGSQDVLINLGGAAPGDKYNKALFANPGQGNNWLSLKLTGVKSNREAVGARIKAVVEEAPGKPVARYRVVTSGGSFGSSSFTQSIGLGKAAQVSELEIYWPASKTRQVFRNVAANQFIEIKETEKDYTKRTLRSFAFTGGAKPHQHPSATPAPRRPE